MAGQGSSTPLVTAEALTEGLEKLQFLLNTEFPTEKCSSFLKRTKLALRAVVAVEEGVHEGLQHPLSTTSTLSAWRAQLQTDPAHARGCSGSPLSFPLLSREGRWIKY